MGRQRQDRPPQPGARPCAERACCSLLAHRGRPTAAMQRQPSRRRPPATKADLVQASYLSDAESGLVRLRAAAPSQRSHTRPQGTRCACPHGAAACTPGTYRQPQPPPGLCCPRQPQEPLCRAPAARQVSPGGSCCYQILKPLLQRVPAVARALQIASTPNPLPQPCPSLRTHISTCHSPYYYLANALGAFVDQSPLWKESDASIAAALDAEAGGLEIADAATRLCGLGSFTHAWGLPHIMRIACKEGE